jgi:hypothetical protein
MVGCGYEDIGFTCAGTNHIWEPEDELNRLLRQGVSFHIVIPSGETHPVFPMPFMKSRAIISSICN